MKHGGEAPEMKAPEAKASEASAAEASADGGALAEGEHYADVDSHEAGASFAGSLTIEGAGVYTFEFVSGEWSIIAVPAEMAEGEACRLMYQACGERIQANEPVALADKTFICLQPAVNAFTVSDESELNPPGKSVVHVRRVLGNVDKPFSSCAE